MVRKTKPIYGIGADDDCCDLYLKNILTTDFSNMVDNLYKIIDTLFPSFKAISTIEADLIAEMGLPPIIYVRFAWVYLYPEIIFNPKNKTHIYLLKDIYDASNLDYTLDEIIVNNL